MNYDDIIIHPLSAKGKYYVDRNACLDHECCVLEAPGNIKMDDEFCAYVYKQPTSEKEEAQWREAMAVCPVEAIHDDGEL